MRLTQGSKVNLIALTNFISTVTGPNTTRIFPNFNWGICDTFRLMACQQKYLLVMDYNIRLWIIISSLTSLTSHFGLLTDLTSNFIILHRAHLFSCKLIKNPPQFSDIRCKYDISIKNYNLEKQRINLYSKYESPKNLDLFSFTLSELSQN